MSSSWEEGARPLSVAILALGGEGGGVLADWIVATAEAAGFEAQTTSVAGVAQRTGATVYYLEMLPPAAASAKDKRPKVRDTPVMSIFPTPGEVDVVIASELMESGRAVQRGFSTADRTTLITSTNRVYSIDEKIALSDGRVDDEKLLEGARAASKRLVADDFMALAEEVGSVISSSLLGALAGSEALPFSREDYEESIRKSGRGVEPSLAAFAAGFDAARSQGEEAINAATQAEALAKGPVVDPFETDATAQPSSMDATSDPIELSVVPGGTAATLDSNDNDGPAHSRLPEERKTKLERQRNETAATNPASLVGPALADLAEQVRDLPEGSRSMILHGLVRTAVFQDKAYAERYLERVKRFAAVDTDKDGEAELTREAARHVALWMAYQDTIQVAQQKLRQGRMGRIRGRSEDPRRTDLRGARVPPPAGRRDHRHAADLARPSALALGGLPQDRPRDDPQGHGPQHQLGLRPDPADDPRPHPPDAPPLGPLRPRAGRDRPLDEPRPRRRPDRPGPGDRDRQAPARPQRLRLDLRARRRILRLPDGRGRHASRAPPTPAPAWPSSTRRPSPTNPATSSRKSSPTSRPTSILNSATAGA